MVQTYYVEDFKAELDKTSILSLPTIGLPYIIYTDASSYDIGATLLQQNYE